MNAPARLDSVGGPPETETVLPEGGAAEGAVASVTEAEPSAAAQGPLVAKVKAAGERIAKLRAGLQQGLARAQDAQIREALTRSELTLALMAAMLGQARARAEARAHAAARYFPPTSARLPRRNRLARRIDRVLARLGSFGKGALIARSRLWRGSGRPLHDLRHMAAYARRGANPDVQPYTLFDQAWYLRTYPDIAAAGAAPLVHYLTEGAAEGRSPHPLLDGPYYAQQNAAELAAARLTPLEHFLLYGEAQGRDPHPLFDLRYYASQAPALNAGESMLEHYMREGCWQGLSPHPLFDAEYYTQQIPRPEQGVPPLAHYLSTGWKTGLRPHPLFDPAWYLDAYPDAGASGVEPLAHFIVAGAQEGRSPSPWFDLPHYVAMRGEGLPAGRNPLIDYLQGGAWQVSEPRPGFPTAAYVSAHPDLARESLTPLEHWARQRRR